LLSGPKTGAAKMSDPHRILWGATEIGLEARIFVKDKSGAVVLDENGNPKVDTNKVYYKVKRRLIDVSRNGRELTSTPARIHASVSGVAA
jgi:hypothetical protein